MLLIRPGRFGGFRVPRFFIFSVPGYFHGCKKPESAILTLYGHSISGRFFSKKTRIKINYLFVCRLSVWHGEELCRGMQEKPELVGGKAATGTPVGREVNLHLFYVQLHGTPAALQSADKSQAQVKFPKQQ